MYWGYTSLVKVGRFWSFVVISLVCSCSKSSNSHADNETITVHVAASLSGVIQELGEAHKASGGSAVETNIAGSGALARQIIAAPRGELFLSANEHWMNSASDAGSIESETVVSFLTNQLVLVVPTGSNLATTERERLCELTLEHLCIGDPSHVPAGTYAKAWLQDMECGEGETLWSKWKDKVIPAGDVRAALAQVLAVSDGVAVVYKTDYLARSAELEMIYGVPIEDAPPIQYFAGRISGTEKAQATNDFLAFMNSPEGRSILAKHGFGSPSALSLAHPE